MYASKNISVRRLPHIQPIGKSYFVTMRLHRSVPLSIIRELADEYNQQISRINGTQEGKQVKTSEKFELQKKFAVKYDRLLHLRSSGPMFLAQDSVIKICKEYLHLHDGILYRLIAYTISPNHVHLLFDPTIQLENLTGEESKSYLPMQKIVEKIKSSIAFHANELLGRKGQFWAKDTFDIYVNGDEMLRNIIMYISNERGRFYLAQNCCDVGQCFISKKYADL